MAKYSTILHRRRHDAMRNLLLAALGAFMLFMPASASAAQDAEVLVHVFGSDGSGAGGVEPYGGVVLDSSGNAYGTASYGGAFGRGLVWEMYRGANGQWTEKRIYNFGEANGDDSYGPLAGLVFDHAGSLYGTTIGGGQPAGQAGTVFELSLDIDGEWIYKRIHTFGVAEGQQPRSAVVFDSAGNLYGNTSEGGAYNEGTIFKLIRGSDGTWLEQTLYSFGANSQDSGGAFQPVALDASGNIWGTLYTGGTYGLGAIFELSPNSSGDWIETIVYSFPGGTNGEYPQCGLIFDAKGNLYGTVSYGGSSDEGLVYELSPSGNGGWTTTTLYDVGNVEGFIPYGSLTFGKSGNLYGATWQGGPLEMGNIYALHLTPAGVWTGKNIHSLRGGLQGCRPDGPVAMDSAGNLYDTTLLCGEGQGTNGAGVVFEIATTQE
jgi:uncharacterized repeat protein (TIGR03803 family)